MKCAMGVAFFIAFALSCVSSLSLVKQDPVMDSMKDSFGKSNLEVPCSKIECGEYSCPTPFELKVDQTCCGYCWAPDHEVNVDRHVVVAYNATGFAVEQCESAPSTCKGPSPTAVRCFKPNCRAGDVPNCAPDACCPMCTAR
mmetsp:Transcript_35777/g.57004  ORF Transcript_35777/g.57004 Transcript_35777/m.57004 type:complete len:142 (+) Transcript_35777:65-490(+)